MTSCYVPWLPDLRLPAWFQASVFHVILAPRRVACHWSFDFCEKETFNEAGFSSYLVPLIKLHDELERSHKFVQVVVVLGGLPWLFGSFVLEHLFLAPRLFLLMVACVVLVFHHFQTKDKA
jgi:hypothetical protein